MNSNFQRSLLPSSSSKSKSLVTLPWGRRQQAPLKHLCICASLYSVIVCDGNFQILYYEAVCTLTSYHALFCNLIHLPNKLFLVVCCYKTKLIFYLQKFTLNFLQNYLDLCRFGVQDKQIWELMKIWKLDIWKFLCMRWSKHSFIFQYIYLYYGFCCYCYYYYCCCCLTFVKNQLLNCWFCINSIWHNLKGLHQCHVCICELTNSISHIYKVCIHLLSIYASNFTCLTMFHQLLPWNQMLKKMYFTL
jgi:hypothetical protein